MEVILLKVYNYKQDYINLFWIVTTIVGKTQPIWYGFAFFIILFVKKPRTGVDKER